MKPYYETELGKLYHGDCLEIMPQLGPVDLVLTDPPYNSSYGTDIERKWRPNPIKHDFGDWDKGFCPQDSITKCLCLNPKGVVCFVSDNTFGDVYGLLVKNFEYCKYIVWDKTNPSPSIRKTTWRQSTELIIHGHNNGGVNFSDQNDMRNVIKEGTCSHQSVDHPTQKPSALINKLLCVSSNENDLVLDMFAGSGTTLWCCERLKRKWIGIEISEKYCEIAANRIENERKQLKLF